MLLILIAFAVFGVFIMLLDTPFKNRIEESTSVEESIRARRILSRFRRFWAPFLIVAFCFLMIVVDMKIGQEDQMAHHVAMIIVLAILEGIIPRLRGNVQANSKDEYLAKYKDKGYVLYLRAFESDFYSQDPKAHSFEGDLNKAFEKFGKNLCAIGMTKELDAPYGATRVYVSDESWQADVKELMQHADKIIILASDRQSCIWEISQSAEMLRKTFFIFDSESRYANVKNSLQDSIYFPEFEDVLRKLADRREEWELGEQDSPSELKAQLETGDIKLGLALHDDGFDIVKIGDTLAFVEDVYNIAGSSDNEDSSKRSVDAETVLKKKKRWYRIAMVGLIVLLALVIVLSKCFDIVFPDWTLYAFVIPFAALIIWKWWFWK